MVLAYEIFLNNFGELYNAVDYLTNRKNRQKTVFAHKFRKKNTKNDLFFRHFNFDHMRERINVFSRNLIDRFVDTYRIYVRDLPTWRHPIIYLYTEVRLLTVQTNIMCTWIRYPYAMSFVQNVFQYTTTRTRCPRMYYIFEIRFCLLITWRFIVTGKKYRNDTRFTETNGDSRFEKSGAKFCAGHILCVEMTVVIGFVASYRHGHVRTDWRPCHRLNTDRRHLRETQVVLGATTDGRLDRYANPVRRKFFSLFLNCKISSRFSFGFVAIPTSQKPFFRNGESTTCHPHYITTKT